MKTENRKNSKLLGLQRLKDKLLNLNPFYNRKIRFYVSERLAWDLAELLSKNDPKEVSDFSFSVLNLLINPGKSKENLSLDLEKLFSPLTPEDISKFQKKIIHLQRKNLAVYQEKGYKALFLGIIFVRGYFYSTKNVLRLVNAPLFLLPCNLEKVKSKGLSLLFNSERKINYSLLYYLQKELALSKEKLTDFENKIKSGEKIGKLENYLIFLSHELQKLVATSSVKVKLSSAMLSLVGEGKGISFPTENETRGNEELSISPFSEPILTVSSNKKGQEKNFQPEPFVKLILSNKPKNYPENQLEVVLNFCLTIDSEPNLSLFRDFEEIIEEYSQDRVVNWSKSALDLLRGEAGNVVAYPKQEEINQPPKPLYLPFESDPSQTRILKVIFRRFSESTLCIDGPPGTGKSQLICNLLANALAYQKKVLVVCEKEVALKVIYEKLSGISLNCSIIKINELAQTSQVYQDILNHLEKNQQERANRYVYLGNEKQLADLEERQASNLKKIANYCQVESEFRTSRQIPLQEVYLKFNKEYQLSPTLIQLNKWVKNKEQLEKLKINLEKYVNRFSKIFEKQKPVCLQLKDNFLENNSLRFEFNWENKNNFQEIVNNLLWELEGKKNETNFLSRICCLKLIQECSKNHQSTKLLGDKLKDLAELEKETNYQNFSTFLQLKNFADFWQKCINKDFLLAIQQFISEEFLVLGELHFFHANFDENTQKNIDYFLRKVLVDQEFKYLNDYGKICEQAVYFNWIKGVEEENRETLANWNQEELIRIQNEQREIVKKKNDLSKLILKGRQKENLNKVSANQSLIKELNKKRKISSLKKLFPELVNYFPIWLTTPEVIASITNWQEVPFDFLVFDEASQVPLEKSIPLWARAKKCIVIGDEQQLPPTDFFKSHLETEEEVWEQEEERILSSREKNINLEIDDLEKNSNLLSYAKKYARNREKLTLLYHYRSRYPELIEFSNQAFYNSILQIVSASERRRDYSPIEYHYQSEGRWIDMENQAEARYIAELLKKPQLVGKQVGIITFNSKQRDLLIDLVDEGNNYKNLFIKNLEEVQGDERDIIIFSIGYGPNKEGKILLNFGPLSNEGGEKRLNVAISRAREKIIVVTSLKPGDLNRIVDKDENRKLGPKLFKNYLEYAYRCWKKEPEKVQDILEKSLPKIVSSSLFKKSEEQEEFGSLFEEQVYNELISQNSHGYEVHKQVKSIGYRIDLAIWDSQLQQYVLGIECDGEYWHGKLENIERDIYRQQLLEDKGWKIIRVLSRDWCRNKEVEVLRIKRELNGCKGTNFSENV